MKMCSLFHLHLQNRMYRGPICFCGFLSVYISHVRTFRTATKCQWGHFMCTTFLRYLVRDSPILHLTDKEFMPFRCCHDRRRRLHFHSNSNLSFIQRMALIPHHAIKRYSGQRSKTGTFSGFCFTFPKERIFSFTFRFIACTTSCHNV